MSPNSLLSRVRGLRFTARSQPAVLLLLCFLAYGLLINRLGFYWDDWPWVWLSHVYGPQGMLQIDQQFRPLAGVILYWGALLAGTAPLGWQILNLLYRWSTGLALWWLVRQLWPRQGQRAVWVAFLFLVYPGFQQQFISVNSSRHILPLAVFFLSLGLMVRAARQPRLAAGWWGASILTMILAMLSTEYYFGLEFARPVVLWLALAEREPRPAQRFKLALAGWAAFLLVLSVLFVWRFSVSQQVNYPVTLFGQFGAQPLETLFASARTGVLNIITALFLAWERVFIFPERASLGLKVVGIYWLLALGTAALTAGYLSRLEPESRDRTWLQVVGLGGAALLVAGLPFLVTGILVELSFPADRTTLPMMFGASLVLAGLLEGLLRSRALRTACLSLAVGLAVGAHFLNAASYQRDWQEQRALFNQLVWRAPTIQPGTALFYVYNLALQDFHSTDNSLTAPLNWVYAPDFRSGGLPYLFYDLRLHSRSTLSGHKAGAPIQEHYGWAVFTGSTSNILLIRYAPPACLRVLLPQYDALNPQLPELLASALPLSDPARIQPQPVTEWPEQVFGPPAAPDWCYYFEKADLARQLGDWQQVVDIEVQAFSQPDRPRHAAELVPFIQGNAYLGRWERSAQLTLEALKINTLSGPLLSAVWGDLWRTTPESAQRLAAFQSFQKKLDCLAP